MNITVIRSSARVRETWFFHLLGTNFVLDTMKVERLPPRCRNWKETFKYAFNTNQAGVAKTPPELPPDLGTALLDHVRSKLQVIHRNHPEPWSLERNLILELPLPDPV